jgi:RNA polymerase sigma-70 factor (ECF subfamily)
VRWRRGAAPAGDALSVLDDRPEDAEVAALVARAKRGDGDAFARLYRRYLDDVYGFVASRLAGREAAEDATQAIFVRALQSLHTCREDAAFPGWLFAIARNVVTDRYRAGRFQAEPWDAALDPTDPALSPEELVIQRDDAGLLRQARERCLSGSERDLFDLLLTDLNDKQIAAVLGRTHGAVRTAHWRLLAKLRDCLERLGWNAEVRRGGL